MLAFSEITLSFKNERTKYPQVWEYLAKRGITREIAEKCNLHILPAIELIAAARRSPNINAVDNRAAIVFPHWKLGSSEPIEWWSSRLVDLAPPGGNLKLVKSFEDLVDQTQIRRPGKMFCPPNEPPHGYLSPIYDWKDLGPQSSVYIHESAIKAINGSILGFASVGLNGVWGWSSKKHGLALIEELKDLPWKAKKLQPIIVFDSNAWDNWQVQQAESSLAMKLFEITGQRALSLRVPKHMGEDQGFDDFRARVGDQGARDFLLGKLQGHEFIEIELSEISQLMLQLSNEVCVVRELGRIADQATGDLMSRMTFTDVNYAHFTSEVENENGNIRQVNVPKLWLADPRRVEVQSLEYSPGQERLVRSETGLPNLNLWRGMGINPEPGDVEPWLELLANNVHDDELRQWIIAWCAYPLQNLGKKLNSFILMFGPSGMGKNLFFKPFHHIYGDNSIMIGTDALKSQFTSLYAQRQFVHADELVRARGAEEAVSQKIKALVTQERVTVNKKGQPEYSIKNHANLVITSNYNDCVKLDQDDRRACVIKWEGSIDRRGDQPYWSRYVRWTESGGSEALFDYLLKQDIRWFDPAAWAPSTPWKEVVKEAGMGPLESWVKDLWYSPQEVLPLIGVGKALWTAKELATLYYGLGENELSPGQIKALANCLSNQGFVRAHDGNLIRRPGGVAERFWVIQQKGKKWDLDESVRHLKTTK